MVEVLLRLKEGTRLCAYSSSWWNAHEFTRKKGSSAINWSQAPGSVHKLVLNNNEEQPSNRKRYAELPNTNNPTTSHVSRLLVSSPWLLTPRRGCDDPAFPAGRPLDTIGDLHPLTTRWDAPKPGRRSPKASQNIITNNCLNSS